MTRKKEEKDKIKEENILKNKKIQQHKYENVKQRHEM